MTNQEFTRGAREQADANQVELITRGRVEEQLGANPITNHEFNDALYDGTLFAGAQDIESVAGEAAA